MSQTNMSKSASQVIKILQNNYVHEGPYSHVSLIVPRGKFSLMSRPLLEDFWINYSEAISEHNKVEFGLAEVPQTFIPVLVDIDLKFTNEAILQASGHFYTEDLVRKMIIVYQQVIRDLVVFDAEDNLDFYLRCVWLDKPPYKVAEDKWKNGFHLHFPNLFVNRIEQETRLIPAVKKYLDANFEQYGIESSIIDSKAVGNTWLLYGSVKNEGMRPYKIAAAYDAKAEPCPLDVLAESVIFNDKEDKITMDATNWTQFLPRILSILAYGRKCFQIRKQEHCIRDYVCSNRNEVKREIRGSQLPVAFSKIRQLVDLFSARRSEGHDDWMYIGWAIYNLTNGSEAGLDLWIKFSLRSDEHDEDRCIYEWSRMTNRGAFKLGTLIHFARLDDPVGYKEFVARNNVARENYTESGLADLFYDHCQDNIAYCNKTWYIFGEHFWKEDTEALKVKSHMIEVLRNLLTSLKKERDANDVREEKEDGAATEQKDPILTAKYRLNTMRFVNSIIDFAKIRFERETFKDDLNRNVYLIGFANGVYDLKSNIFRKGQPDDMITNHMKISYREFDESHPKVIETRQFFEKVFTNENIRRYFMDVMSEVFIGHNHRKKVWFWTGGGDNAKSVTQMFFAKMLGPLCVKAPTTLITSARGQSGTANAEMARLGNGVRVVFLEEPDPDEQIHSGIFKHLSGNDEFYARDLFERGKDVREIQPMMRLIIICNSLPRMSGGGDQATWNRAEVFPFTSQFKRDAPITVEEQLKTSIFPIDTTLSQKIPEMTEALAWILIKHMNEPKSPAPEEVIAATREYQTANDMIQSFMTIHVVQEEDAVSTKFDLYEMYKEFCKDICSGRRPLTFMEFVKSIEKKLGAPTTIDSEGWIGYRTRSARTGGGSRPDCPDSNIRDLL